MSHPYDLCYEERQLRSAMLPLELRIRQLEDELAYTRWVLAHLDAATHERLSKDRYVSENEIGAHQCPA